MEEEQKGVIVEEDTEQIPHKRFKFGKFVITVKNITLERFEDKLCGNTVKELGRQQYEIKRWLTRNIRPADKRKRFTMDEYERAFVHFKSYLFKGYDA